MKKILINMPLLNDSIHFSNDLWVASENCKKCLFSIFFFITNEVLQCYCIFLNEINKKIHLNWFFNYEEEAPFYVVGLTNDFLVKNIFMIKFQSDWLWSILDYSPVYSFISEFISYKEIYKYKVLTNISNV